MIFATKNDQISIYQDIKIVSSNDILEDVIFGSFQDIFLVCPINGFRDNVCNDIWDNLRILAPVMAVIFLSQINL